MREVAGLFVGAAGPILLSQQNLCFGVLGILSGTAPSRYGLGRIYGHAVACASQSWLFVVWALTAVVMYEVRNDTFTWRRVAV